MDSSSREPANGETRGPEDGETVWLFQAVPETFDLAAEVASVAVGDEDDWTVTRYREEMNQGDLVILWQGGQDAGVYALARLTGRPFHRDQALYREDDAAGEWAVPYRYEALLQNHLTRETVLQDEVLRSMLVIRQPAATNFKVSPEEWRRMQQLVPEFAVAPEEGLVSQGWVVRPWQPDQLEYFRAHSVITLPPPEPYKSAGDLTGRDAGAIDEAIKAAAPEQPAGRLATWGDFCERFVNEILPAELVLAPAPNKESALLGEVRSGYRYEPDEPYKHVRDVEWLAEVDVGDLPEAAARSLGSPATVFRLKEPEAVRALMLNPPVHTVWWVNQGQSWRAEREGGYLWAPKNAKDGRPRPYHTSMTEVREGDAIVHYVAGNLRAVSRARGQASDTARPGELPVQYWEEDGYRLDTEYFELAEPIPLQSIPSELRVAEHGPFTSDGVVKQGYLWKLSPALARELRVLFADRWPPGSPLAKEGTVTLTGLGSAEEELAEIAAKLQKAGLRITERVLRRLHLSLQSRGFVVLSGVSGTGKTWLAQEYASAVGGRSKVVSVAPNWTSNEDLLGFFNPIDKVYHHTAFSLFLQEAAKEYEVSLAEGRTPRRFFVVLDEMNLARVEYYFAKFLSAMEVRARAGVAHIELADDHQVALGPNLAFIGTVNVDETTHGFSDKVYDRAQLIELELNRADVGEMLSGTPYRDVVLKVWDAVRTAGPFAFRIIDEMKAYVAAASDLGVPWQEAIDDLLLQKVLPKLTGTDLDVGRALEVVAEIAADQFPHTKAKASLMLAGYAEHGFASYF